MLRSDGWLFTGDLATCDERGCFRIVDRKKDMIITGGFNVFPSEVEHAILAHPEVLDCAVIGVPDAKWIEAVKGVVCLKFDHTVTEAELITHCKRQIAGYKCPKSIVFISQLPRSATGKIDKLTLRTWYRQG